MRTLNNEVLIQVTEYEKSSELISPDWGAPAERTINIPRMGVIRGIPLTLNYKRSGGEDSMRWKTNIEIQEGDEVWFSHYAAGMALNKGDNPIPKTFSDGDIVYILLKYEDLIVVKRKEKVIPLNGYLIVKPTVHGEIKTSIPEFVTPESMIKLSKVICDVVHVGEKLQDWNDMFLFHKGLGLMKLNPWEGKGGDYAFEDDVKAGDRIFVTGICRKLENEINQSFCNNLVYYIQRREVGMLVDEDVGLGKKRGVI